MPVNFGTSHQVNTALSVVAETVTNRLHLVGRTNASRVVETTDFPYTLDDCGKRD